MNKIVQFPLVRMLISLVFIGIGIAVGHAGATIFSAIAIALQAGVLLGTTYALTGRL